MMSASPLHLKLLSLVLFLLPILGKDTDIVFQDCDSFDYYHSLQSTSDDPQQWTREQLHALISESHRNVLLKASAESDENDVYQAIMDLDAGAQAETVQLFYRQVPAKATPTNRSWVAQPFWSTDSAGVDLCESLTDVHQIRPVDILIVEEKRVLNYGMCNTGGATESPCSLVAQTSDNNTRISANVVNETAQDDKIWQPPQSLRGVVARALLYTELRYNGLTLQDCEPFQPGQMGYLSQLLQWNSDHPPDEQEISRNTQACVRWQGNRNPFIDYPELATILHGSPQDMIGNMYTSCFDLNTITNDNLPIKSDSFVDATANSNSETTTSAPTMSPTLSPDHCAEIGRGNLPFFLVNTQEPEEVLFLSLQKIHGNMELYLTDEAWNGREFIRDQPNEGTIMVSCYWLEQ